MADGAPPEGLRAWERAALALGVLAVDPVGLGGLWLRARSGPARERFLEGLGRLPLPLRKVHPNIPEDQLFGGIDLTAALQAGRIVRCSGILEDPAAIVLTMAERCPPRLAAHLAKAIDRSTHAVIALDEGADRDEIAPPALIDRLGLFVALDGVPVGATRDWMVPSEGLAAARDRLRHVELGDDGIRILVETAAALGIGSLRPPLQAMAAAKALAALAGHGAVCEDDLRNAVDIVYAHRAAMADPGEDEGSEMPDPSEAPGEPSAAETQGAEAAPDLLLEAAQTALPAGVLEALAAGRAARARGAAEGSGATRKGNRRGRPRPARPGHPSGGGRVDIVATLRAAAPWQRIRRAAQPDGPPVLIRTSDIRIRQFEETSDRLLIFTVDASGSLAMARLAEAKGAVELLLGQAYSRRDHVALIAFRGETAEVLLPPTRSLLQAKRRLQALPGGGGTPLASGLARALETAELARSKGMTPALALLTDGRANIALDGSPGRGAAAADAERMARILRAEGLPGLVVDTAPRPQNALRDLAGILDARYIALPRADAHRLSAAVSAALDG